MNKNLIKNFISNIEKKDIINYAKKENIKITDYEINLMLKLLKTDTDIILSEKFPEYINSYKNEFSKNVYNILIEKYKKYKSFIL